jgi:predicted nucleic acid-binding protein
LLLLVVVVLQTVKQVHTKVVVQVQVDTEMRPVVNSQVAAAQPKHLSA